jgi:hypothetical protein
LGLALGSMGALLAELDRRGIRTKVNGRRDGQKRGEYRYIAAASEKAGIEFIDEDGGDPGVRLIRAWTW